MGLLNALFRTKKRTLVTHMFNHIREDIGSPYLAQYIKNLMDKTSSFRVDPDDLWWFTFDDLGNSEKKSLEFRARFKDEDEDGSRIYIDSVGVEGLGNFFFLFKVRKDGYQLDLAVSDPNGDILVGVMMILGE